MISLSMLLLIAADAATATPRPAAADIAAARQFVLDDRSFAAQAKIEALSRVDRLTEHLGDPARFELELAKIVALADNGHTAYFPAQWTLRYPRSPVRLGLFADGVFVIAAPTTHRHLLGERVTRINGHTVDELRAAYRAYQGGAPAFKDQFLPHFLETPALLSAAGYGDDRNRLHLTDAKGESTSVEAVMAPLEGEAAFLGVPMLREATSLIEGERPLYLRDPDKLYDFVPLAGGKAAYIRIDAIGGDGLSPFLTQSLERLRAGRQRDIILDLRFNMGGDLNRARDFANALPALAKGGHVYAITSGRTFSAAISTLGYLKQAAPEKVVIVGEPVGDRLEFWAEGGVRELPGIGAKLLLATERHNYRTGCPESDCHGAIRDHPIRVDSLQPDLPTYLSFKDLVAGRDPAMAAIDQRIARP